MSNPRSLKAQIAKEEGELNKLKFEEQRLNRERREFLMNTALAPDEERQLQELETELLTLHASRDRLRGRIAERKQMLPALEKEQSEAEKRLEELKDQIRPLAKELIESDDKIIKLYEETLRIQDRTNDVVQRLVGWVTEAQFLSKRFGLDGSGLRTPGRPRYHGVWQRIRILSLWEPTPPAAFSDKLKVLDGERNITEKKQRREKVQKQTAECVEKHGGARVVQGS